MQNRKWQLVDLVHNGSILMQELRKDHYYVLISSCLILLPLYLTYSLILNHLQMIPPYLQSLMTLKKQPTKLTFIWNILVNGPKNGELKTNSELFSRKKFNSEFHTDLQLTLSSGGTWGKHIRVFLKASKLTCCGQQNS